MVYPHIGAEFINRTPGRRLGTVVPGACGTLGQSQTGLYTLPHATSNLTGRGREAWEAESGKQKVASDVVNHERGKGQQENRVGRSCGKSSQVS